MKTEPTVGSSNVITSLFKRGKKDHEKLVADALDMFTKAEDNLQNAVEQINDDIEDEQKEIRAAEKRIADAEGHRSRLTRTLDRIKALTA